MKHRQKYYFLDYTDKVNITKRILSVLLKRHANTISDIDSDDIIKSLRWKNIKRQSINATIQCIDIAFDILQQLHIVELLRKKPNDKDDSFRYTFKVTYPDADFDMLIKNSGFSPIEGSRQILTEEMKEKYMSDLAIDYNNIVKSIDKQGDYSNQIETILPTLTKSWKRAYCKMGNPNPCIKGFSFETYETLFDQIEEYPDDDVDTLSDSYIEERTVVAYGFSSKPKTKRHQKDCYMQGDDQRKWAGNDTDRGHFIAHSFGGDIWTNVFPQRRDINRGTSEAGKKYKSMEQHLQKNEGLFCFSRPIYFDFYNRPYLIEYGYITKDFQMIMEVFENV